MSALQNEGINLKFIRTLGVGGNGLATLFEIQHGTSASPKKFVVKSSLDPSSADMDLEKYYMMVRMSCIGYSLFTPVTGGLPMPSNYVNESLGPPASQASEAYRSGTQVGRGRDGRLGEKLPFRYAGLSGTRR